MLKTINPSFSLKVLILISLGFPAVSFAQSFQQKRAPKGCIGKIKTIKTYVYRLDNEHWQAHDSLRLLLSLCTYNPAGQKTEELQYGYDGKVSDSISWKYDSLGRITEFSDRIEYAFYTYNKDGQLVEVRYFTPDKSDVKTIVTMQYDANGDQVLLLGKYPSGRVIRKEAFEYNNNHQKTAFARFDEHGQLSIKTTYRFDDKGNKIEELSRGIRDSIKHAWKFDDHSRVIEYLRYDGPMDVFSYKVAYTYDEKGDTLSSASYNSNGDLRDSTAFQFDTLGREVENTIYYSDGAVGVRNFFRYQENNSRVRSAFDGQGCFLERAIEEYDYYGNRVELVRSKQELTERGTIDRFLEVREWQYTYFE